MYGCNLYLQLGTGICVSQWGASMYALRSDGSGPFILVLGGTDMSAFTSAQEAFTQSVRATKLLLDLESHSESPFMHMTQFGYHGYSISVFQLHVDYLNAVNESIAPMAPIFDSDAIDRWKLVNELLVAGFAPRIPGTKQMSDQFPALAALAAFPTLEEIARRLANCWDADGRLCRDITERDGVTLWNNDGTETIKTYKEKQRIVILSNKLQLAHQTLEPRLRSPVNPYDHRPPQFLK